MGRIDKWIGFDFDGTLAKDIDPTGKFSTILGPPVQSMVDLAKQYINDGFEVKIFTARAEHMNQIPVLEKWCEAHLGKKLEITNKKDHKMSILFDDRAIAVKKNEGICLGFRDQKTFES